MDGWNTTVDGRNPAPVDMGVSKNNGTPKSSILIGFSIINHPFWGTTIFGNIHMVNIPQFTRFYTSQVDSRISSINSSFLLGFGGFSGVNSLLVLGSFCPHAGIYALSP